MLWNTNGEHQTNVRAHSNEYARSPIPDAADAELIGAGCEHRKFEASVVIGEGASVCLQDDNNGTVQSREIEKTASTLANASPGAFDDGIRIGVRGSPNSGALRGRCRRSGVELAEVVVEMLGLKLTRKLSADRAEARIDWPLTVDGPTHELRDQLFAPRTLGLEVILTLGNGALVRGRGLGPWHVEQENLHDWRRYWTLLRLERSFADRRGKELIHVPEHLIDAHASPLPWRVRADRVEACFDGAANGWVVKH